MADLLTVGTPVLVNAPGGWGYEDPQATIAYVDNEDPNLTYRVAFNEDKDDPYGFWMRRDQFTVADEPLPTIGAKEIEFSEIKVGDTVRLVTEGEWYGVKETNTYEVIVARIGEGEVWTSEDGRVFNDGTWYLLDRPEQDPEVQAIIDALDVSVDTAADYHSKGLRVVSA